MSRDEERWLALERDYRRQVRKAYYRREEDFATLVQYNDYLEEVEEIVAGLVDEKQRPATRARLDKLRAADPSLTAHNRARLDEDRNAMSAAVEAERREAQQRAAQRLQEAKEAAEEEARAKAELQDEVAAGKTVADAQAELERRRAAAPAAAAAGAAAAGKSYSYVPTAGPARPADVPRAQPLHEQREEAPKLMTASAFLPREAYEDAPAEMSAICRAGGHSEKIWRQRYEQEAFGATGLWFELPAA